MKVAIFLLSLLVVTAPAAAQRQLLGIFFNWGAFQEGNPQRCFALAQPLPNSRKISGNPFASVAFWPGGQPQGQVYVRLGRAAREGSAVILRVDDRSFVLVGRGADAWAKDPRADAQIIAAMRTGLVMIVETRASNGGLMRDRYRLRGAATAIDAAAVACAPPPPR